MEIKHDLNKHCFECTYEYKHNCELIYELMDNRMTITHVYVPRPAEGKGIAAQLVKKALEYARAEHLRVRPVCPYAKAYMEKHNEYHDIMD